jgi:hypothetical protein
MRFADPVRNAGDLAAALEELIKQGEVELDDEEE